MKLETIKLKYMETAKVMIPVELIEEIAMLTQLLDEREEGITHPTEYKSKLKMTLSQLERKLEI